MCCFLELFSSPSQNSNFVDKIRHLRVVDDDYIDKHFGTDSAQYQRETAFELMNGGNIGLSTVMIRNVQSKLKPGKKLIAIKFKCLSKEARLFTLSTWCLKTRVQKSTYPLQLHIALARTELSSPTPEE